MIAATVSIRERSCVCFVDAGLEALGCQDDAYLVMNLPIKGMPAYGEEECWQGLALCELWEFASSVIYLSNAKSSYSSVPAQCWYASEPALAFKSP